MTNTGKLLITGALVLFAAPLLAADAEPGDTHDNGQMMKQMHTHMQSMQKTMDRIHQADDSAEQKKLMHEHMQSMRDGMNMMGRMSQHESKSMGPEGSPMGSDAMPCKDDDKQRKRMKSMEMQQHSMQQRMQMMEHAMMHEQMSDE